MVAGAPLGLPGKKADWREEDVQQAVQQALSQHPNSLLAFTDGSKTDNGVGAAFVIPERQQSGQQALPSWAAVATAEVVAIRLLLETLQQSPPPGDVVICSDSQAAIQQLIGFGFKHSNAVERWRILTLAKNLSSTTGGKVVLQWTPSHCGVAGNERADELAREATEMVPVELPPTKKEMNSYIRQSLQSEWQQEWDNDTKGRFRYGIAPLGERRWAFSKRAVDVQSNRLRLGKVKTAGWKAQILHEGDGRCVPCRTAAEAAADAAAADDRLADALDSSGQDQLPVETLTHLLLHCPELQQQRSALLSDLQLPAAVPVVPAHLLQRQQPIKRTILFLRKAGVWSRLCGYR